jgi:hypothetical protein
MSAVSNSAEREPPLVFRSELAASAAVVKCQVAETRPGVKWEMEWSRLYEGFVIVARRHGLLCDVL